MITGAALIMVSVFSAFALAESITIKSIGVGHGDRGRSSTRRSSGSCSSRPTMRLMGRWNWWAPGPLGRLADRLGFSHAEDEPDAESTGDGDAPGAPGDADPAEPGRRAAGLAGS